MQSTSVPAHQLSADTPCLCHEVDLESPFIKCKADCVSWHADLLFIDGIAVCFVLHVYVSVVHHLSVKTLFVLMNGRFAGNASAQTGTVTKGTSSVCGTLAVL